MSLLGRLRSGVKKCGLPLVRATSELGLKKHYLQPENSGLLGGNMRLFLTSFNVWVVIFIWVHSFLSWSSKCYKKNFKQRTIAY